MHRGTLLILAGIIVACSDSAAPAPGSFRANLTGARVASLSGFAIAETNFVEEYPDLHSVVRMHATRSDTVHTLAVRCRGDEAPDPGEYPVDSSGESCVGFYSLTLVTDDGGAQLLESATISSGLVAIRESEPGQVVGSFRFSGTLSADDEPVGILEASGSFNADAH